MARKICVLTSAHPAFDVRIFHKECKSLARAGYDVVLVATETECVSHEGISLDLLPRRVNRLDRMTRGTFAVFRSARKAGADVYHFHDPELIPVALLLRFLGAKVVYDIHEDLPRTISYKRYIPAALKNPVSRTVEFIENWASRRFSGLVTATSNVADRFKGMNRNLVVLNNYPKREELVTPIPGHHGKREPILVYVGMRISWARGADEMVRSMSLLAPELGAQLRLVGNWDDAGMPQALSSVPGWERTTFVGPLGRPGVTKELERAAAGLVILHPEPNYVMSEPVKLFEYMAAGLPVIASDFPLCREIINQARCGLLVDPLDPREIASAITYLLTHPEEAEQMGQRGRQAVQEQYNWANEEKKLLRFYNGFFRNDPARQETLVSRSQLT